MRLLDRKPVFNVYELFSDLIFCSLVLFLFLILVLAINVDSQIQKGFDEQQKREFLKTTGADRRFVGSTGYPELNAVPKYENGKWSFRFLRSALANSLSSRSIGTDESSTQEYRREMRQVERELASARGYSEAEFCSIVSAFSQYAYYTQRSMGLQLKQVDGKLVCSKDYCGELSPGTELVSVDGKAFSSRIELNEFVNDRHSVLIKSRNPDGGLTTITRLRKRYLRTGRARFTYRPSLIEMDERAPNGATLTEEMLRVCDKIDDMLPEVPAEKLGRTPVLSVGLEGQSSYTVGVTILSGSDLALILQSIEGRSVAIEFPTRDLPDCVWEDVLIPSGCVHPQADETQLRSWYEDLHLRGIESENGKPTAATNET